MSSLKERIELLENGLKAVPNPNAEICKAVNGYLVSEQEYGNRDRRTGNAFVRRFGGIGYDWELFSPRQSLGLKTPTQVAILRSAEGVRELPCTFEEDLLETAKEALDRRVQVTGSVRLSQGIVSRRHCV